MIFGLFMIIGSVLQYVYINEQLNQDTNPNNIYWDLFPTIYIIYTYL